jgi:hypothetical protein
MSRIEELESIPNSDVEEVISDFESEGAQVEKIQQDDGKWTVRATFPD